MTTRVKPVLPTELSQATTRDLLSYFNTRLEEKQEEEDPEAYEERLSDITTELLRRNEDKTS
jgi:hypothetical protein